MLKVENIKEQLEKIKNHPWKPLDVATVNNHEMRLVLFKGDYGWHTHDADEIFVILEGKITIHTKSNNFVLRKGDYMQVPKGLSHNPSSAENSYVLIVRPIHLKTERA